MRRNVKRANGSSARAFKIAVDMGMIVLLLFLMPYELIGEAAHEWVGIGIFVLFILHHVLNRRWSRTLLSGRYTPLRLWQTALVILVLTSMLVSMASGVVLSRHALSFLPIHGGRALGRSLHMLASYWGFVLLALHIGFHWSMMLEWAGGQPGSRLSGCRLWVMCALGLLTAIYGVYAFLKRDIGSYMLLKIEFVFFDFDEPLIFFLLDYAAAMGLFIWLGHYFTQWLKRRQARKPLTFTSSAG